MVATRGSGRARAVAADRRAGAQPGADDAVAARRSRHTGARRRRGVRLAVDRDRHRDGRRGTRSRARSSSTETAPAPRSPSRPSPRPRPLYSRSRSVASVATASAAAPSSRPTNPIPSPRVAFTLTCSGAIPIAPASTSRICSRAGASLRALEHHGRVDVHHRQPAAREQHRHRRAQQLDRVGVAIALVGVGELMADVGQPGRAEQRVDDRVREHVGVGVAGEAALADELDAAEHQSPAGGERMAVVADAGLHGHGARSASSSSASRRSIGSVTLMFSRARRDHAHRAAGPLDQPGVVGCRRQQLVGRLEQRPLQRRAAEHLRRLHRPQAARGRACARPSGRRRPTSLIVSDTGVAAITASAPEPRELEQRALEQLGRWRAAAPRRARSRDRRRRRRAAPRARTADRVAPPATATTPVGRRVERLAGRQRDDDPLGRRSSACSAATLHSSIGLPASVTSALGRPDPRRSPRPAATINATAISFAAADLLRGDRHLCRASSRPRTRRAARRCAPRPRPRPSRARTSARTRGSSSLA